MKLEDIKRMGLALQQVREDSVQEKAKLDPVNPKAAKKDFDDRQDKDLDNDNDVDSTDKYLHKRRKAISKSMDEDDSMKGMVCKSCGDKFGEPKSESCSYESKDPKGKNWVKAEDADKDEKNEENVQELSKKTLGSYVKKASQDSASKAYRSAMDANSINKDQRKSSGKSYMKSVKRQKGIEKATNKLTKEDIDEKKVIDDDKSQFIHAAKMAKKDGKKDFVFAGKKYPVDMNEDEMNEIVGKIARGIGKLAKKTVINKQGNFRLSTAGRADAAQNKAAKMKKKADDINRKKDAVGALKKAKSAVATAKARKEALTYADFKAKFLTDDKSHTKNATPPEGMMDKSKSSKGAMAMLNQPKKVDDTEEKGHKDAVAAGKKGPNAKKRPNDNSKGEK